MSIRHVIELFYLIRPYSWVHSLLIGSAAALLAGFSWLDLSGFLAAFHALLLYIILDLILELKHKDAGRPHVPVWLLISAISISILIAFPSITAIIFTIIVVIFSYAYSLKKSKPWGLLSPLIRGLVVVSNFFVVYLKFTNNISTQAVIFVIILFFITSARNLIGDLRDVKYDLTTFPVKFGVNFTYVVLILLFAGAIISAYFVNSLLSVLLIGFLTMLLIKNSFTLHRVAVIATTGFISSYVYLVTSNLWIFLAIPLDILLNVYFYKKIYRPSNFINNV